MERLDLAAWLLASDDAVPVVWESMLDARTLAALAALGRAWRARAGAVLRSAAWRGRQLRGRFVTESAESACSYCSVSRYGSFHILAVPVLAVRESLLSVLEVHVWCTHGCYGHKPALRACSGQQ